MQRKQNWWIWTGFLIVLTGALSYLPIFVKIPETRDFPWANLLLFFLGLGLIWIGVWRVYRRPEEYRGKIAGPILGGIGGLLLLLFSFGVFYIMRQLPDTTGVVKVGERAPDFTLPDENGKPVSLAQLLAASSSQAPVGTKRAALLIFYRGHW